MFTDLVHDNVFAIFGVPATLTTAQGVTHAITVLDKTRGTEISEGVGMATVLPAADLREAELASLNVARDDLEDGRLTIAGKAWRVDQVQERPSLFGAGDGRLLLVLVEDAR